MTNTHIADRLQTHARDLARRGENLYRVRAFRQAATAVHLLDEPAEDVVARTGRAGLEVLPGIGRSLAETIAVYVTTGEWLSDEGRRLARAG
jgi:DNA polymerase (family 10)